MQKNRLSASHRIDPVTHFSFSTHTVEKTVALHFHDFYELEIVTRGTGVQKLNGIEYRMTPGTVYFLTPIDFHEIQPERDLEVINLVFGEALMPPAIQLELMKRRSNLIFTHPEQARYMELLTGQLLAQRSDGFAENARRDLIELLLIEVLRQKENAGEPCRSAPIQQALSYLFRHFREDVSLDTLSALCGYTPSYFSALFTRTCGMGYREFTERLRVNYAKQLLLSTSLGTAQVGEKSGFSSQAGFFRVFRKHTGTSPASFRKL